MRIAITGATGLVGSNLAAELLGAGHALRATRRAASVVDHLDDLAIDWHGATLADPEALARAFDGCEAVVHCAASVSLRWPLTPAMRASNIDGTRHVIAACRQAGVRRLVHCSSTVTVGVAAPGAVCTEDSAWNLADHRLDDGYSRSKRQSELDALDAAALPGLEVVVVNPGFMLGPRDRRPSSGALLLRLVKGQVPALTAGGNSFVDVRAVARGMRLALERGRSGQRYILAGENLSYAEAFPRFCAIAGVRPPRWQAPFALAALPGLVGTAYEALADRDAPLNLNAVRWSHTPGFAFSSEKARRELGYAPGSLDEGVRAALRWWQERGMLGPLPGLG